MARARQGSRGDPRGRNARKKGGDRRTATQRSRDAELGWAVRRRREAERVATHNQAVAREREATALLLAANSFSTNADVTDEQVRDEVLRILGMLGQNVREPDETYQRCERIGLLLVEHAGLMMRLDSPQVRAALGSPMLRKCPACNGSGDEYRQDNASGPGTFPDACGACNGTGTV